MSVKEDEYGTGQEETGKGLCPFCGSPEISYDRLFAFWRCSNKNCKKWFPTPSYGPGADFGKEARWFGKTTEQLNRSKYTNAQVKKRKTSSFGKRLSLILFFVCLLASAYTGFLLLTHQTDLVAGIIVLALSIAILFQNFTATINKKSYFTVFVNLLFTILVVLSVFVAFFDLEQLFIVKRKFYEYINIINSFLRTPN